jgi:SPP1 gp7 family putative phage head morphogenesis protein
MLRVSPQARRAAVAAERDRSGLERLGLLAVKPITHRLNALGDKRLWTPQRLDLKLAIQHTMTPLVPVLIDAMTAAHLAGRLRTVRAVAAHKAQKSFAMSAYDDALAWQQKRLHLSDDQVAALAKKYGNEAVNVTRGASDFLEDKARDAVSDILDKGMHVDDATERMREAFKAAGVTPANPYTLENLVRTQTATAYSAGRWNAAQDPDVQEILWGYEYCTVGDDRVRPSHEVMDGMRAPAAHPIWHTWFPPAGFSCRCTTIEIFRDDPVEMRTTWIPANDGPDDGWDFNPGEVFSDDLATSSV